MKAKIFTEKDPQELEKALNSFLSRENVSEIYSITPIVSKKNVWNNCRLFSTSKSLGKVKKESE